MSGSIIDPVLSARFFTSSLLIAKSIGSSVFGVSSDNPSDLSSETVPAGRRRGSGPVILLSLAAAACLAVAVAAGAAARADLTRKPSTAQRDAAAAEAVADRWRDLPAGQIFPATLTYSTSLLTTETASRVGVASQSTCGSAIEPGLAGLAASEHCRAGLRATYVDELDGVVYTIGVLAFPNSRDAETFAARLSASRTGPISLLPLALPDTASAQFGPAAGQASTASHGGPFVVLTVAGYADGEPAGPGQQARPAIFAPATQLAGEVIGPLTRPVTVNCASRAWSC